MTQSEHDEFEEMKEWFEDVKRGSKIMKWVFAFLMSLGGAYIMIKTIQNIK